MKSELVSAFVSGTPFLMVYTSDEAREVVEIMALFHRARDPDSKQHP